MSLYDSGVGQHRKPPLHSNQYNNMNDNNNNNNNNSEYNWTNEYVIASVINSDNAIMNEIGCIILSCDLHEKESFSFNFSVDNPFEAQSDYIYSSLNNRIWIINDFNNNINTQTIINNTFKSINKQIPQPQQIINTQQIFNDYKINNNNNLITYSSARIACNHIYRTVQRIAMNQLLSGFTSTNYIDNTLNNPLSTNIQQVIEEQYQPQPQPPVQNNNNNNANNAPPITRSTDEYIGDTNNKSDDAINDIIEQTINNNKTEVINAVIDYETINNNNNVNNEQDAQAQEESQQQEQQINDINNTINNINERNGFHGHPDEQPIDKQSQTEKIEQIEKIEPVQVQVEVEVEQQEIESEQVEDKVLEEDKQTEQQSVESIKSSSLPSDNNIQPISSQSPDNIQPQHHNHNNNNNINNINNIQQQQIQQIQQQQIQQQQQHNNVKLTWANRANKFKSKTPTKGKRLGVVDHVSDNYSSGLGGRGSGRGSGLGGGNIKVTTMGRIRNYINSAINNNKVIWVSYNGHMKPFIPRAIRPIGWDNRNNQKESFFAIQHKSKSQNQQRFYLKNVIEARDKSWRISNEELMQLKKRNPHTNIYQQGYNDNNYNRQRYKNTRPRPYNNNNNINQDK